MADGGTASGDHRCSEDVRAEILSRLRRGRSLGDLGLPVVDGRVDLRGITLGREAGRMVARVGRLAAHSSVGGLTMSKGLLEGVDLSGAHINGWDLRGVRVRDCLFERANCDAWSVWDSSIEHCSFDRSSWRGANVGSTAGDWSMSMRHTSFRHADFRVNGILGAAFAACTFELARLDNVTFFQCRLNDIRFAGRLRSVCFDGRDLSSGGADRRRFARFAPYPGEMVADFSAATFDDVSFRGYRLTGITWPRAGRLMIVDDFPRVAREMLRLLRGDDSPAAKMLSALLDNGVRGPQNEGSVWLENLDDLERWGGDALVTKLQATLTAASGRWRAVAGELRPQ